MTSIAVRLKAKVELSVVFSLSSLSSVRLEDLEALEGQDPGNFMINDLRLFLMKIFVDRTNARTF